MQHILYCICTLYRCVTIVVNILHDLTTVVRLCLLVFPTIARISAYVDFILFWFVFRKININPSVW